MAVYVDNYQATFRRMKMSHMVADSSAELLEMADKIGLNRKWIQKAGKYDEHFDVCKEKRRLAIQAGAVQVSLSTLGRILIEKRKKWKNK